MIQVSDLFLSYDQVSDDLNNHHSNHSNNKLINPKPQVKVFINAIRNLPLNNTLKLTYSFGLHVPTYFQS